MILDDAADLLSSGGIGTVGTNLFKGIMPDIPDACVAVFETGGLPPVHAMASAVGQAVVERPRIQVLCRAAQYDYATARTKAHDVYKLLDGLPARDINGTAYKWIAAVQSPFFIGPDANGRVLISCNFDVVKALTA